MKAIPTSNKKIKKIIKNGITIIDTICLYAKLNPKFPNIYNKVCPANIFANKRIDKLNGRIK